MSRYVPNSPDILSTGGFGYNLNNGLMDYRIALAERANTPCKIYCVGDSITRGLGTSAEPTKSWPGVLRAAMQARYGDAGEGFIHVFEGTLAAGAIPRVTFGAGGWAMAAGSKSGFGAAYANSGGSLNPITFTFTGDRATIIYGKISTGGNADVKIDGVSVGTLNCQNATTSFNNFLTVTAAGGGSHTLTITPATSALVMVEGIFAENGTSGIQVHRVGMSGYKSGDWVNTNAQAAWTGKPPHLAIIALGVNDAWGSISVDTFKTNMEVFIQNFLASGASVVLVPYMQPKSTVTTIWPQFVQAHYDLAKKWNIGLIDVYAAWNKDYNWAQTRGLFANAGLDFSGTSGTNEVHPGDKGHRFIASIIEKHLV